MHVIKEHADRHHIWGCIPSTVSSRTNQCLPGPVGLAVEVLGKVNAILKIACHDGKTPGDAIPRKTVRKCQVKY